MSIGRVNPIKLRLKMHLIANIVILLIVILATEEDEFIMNYVLIRGRRSQVIELFFFNVFLAIYLFMGPTVKTTYRLLFSITIST